MMSKEIASEISVIKRITYFISRKTLLTVYNALVQPYFNYCSVAIIDEDNRLERSLNRPNMLFL